MIDEAKIREVVSKLVEAANPVRVILFGSYGRGDQLVQVQIETPPKLSKEQKELLKRFDELDRDTTHPKHHGFMEKVKELFG